MVFQVGRNGFEDMVLENGCVELKMPKSILEDSPRPPEYDLFP